MHWKFGTRKTYPVWKIRLHSLFCGCNHWWKMQCSYYEGLFIRILRQKQQDTQVFYRNGLFLFSTLYWRTLTLIISFLSYPWSQGTRKLFQHMLSQWEKELKIIIHWESIGADSFSNHGKPLRVKRWGFFLLLSPFISQYCYPVIIFHNVNNFSEASEYYLLQNKRFVQSELFHIYSRKTLVLVSGWGKYKPYLSRLELLSKVKKGKVCPLYWFSIQFHILTDTVGPEITAGTN